VRGAEHKLDEEDSKERSEKQAFRAFRTSRATESYGPAKPWCEFGPLPLACVQCRQEHTKDASDVGVQADLGSSTGRSRSDRPVGAATTHSFRALVQMGRQYRRKWQVTH
jgi:hypothetical protein